MVEIWTQQNIETQQMYRAADKVQILFQQYYEMWRKRNNGGVRLQQRRNAFVQNMEQIFDISRPPIVRGAVEIENERADEQIAGQDEINVPLVYAERQPNQNLIAPVEPVNEVEEVHNVNDVIEPNEERRVQWNVINEGGEIKPDKDVCLMFDHIGVSHRYASLAFITMAKYFGADPGDIVSSTSTMFRCRQQHRTNESNNIKETYDITKMVTIHWDGKTYTSRGHVKQKKLAVVLSNSKEAKLLDVETVADGSADTHVQVILRVMEDWNVQENIVSMCFDTEAVNTGRISGVCVQMEHRLARELLHLACRHHVYEIFLSASFESTVESAERVDGPKIPIFEKFAKQYYEPDFNKQNFNSCREDRFFDTLLGIEEMNRLEMFCREKLTQIIVRNDYSELLKLTLLLVSENCEFRIHAPGAYNRARFMCRVIYCMKMYLYRSQLRLQRGSLDNIRRFLLYFLKVHVKYWFNVKQAVKAPNQDLQMLKDLHEFKEVMPVTAEAVIKKFNNHLWYLSQTLIALAFFDDEVSVGDKLLMVQNLYNGQPKEGENENRATIQPDRPVKDLNLSDFVTTATKRFFEITGINTRFLEVHPNQWPQNRDFRNGQEIAMSFSVTNDSAERSIALYQTFKNNVKKPQQERHLVQVAEKRRRDCKKLRKQDVIQSLDFQ